MHIDESQRCYEQFAWTNALLEVDFDRVRRQRGVNHDGVCCLGPRSLSQALFSVKDVFATQGIRTTAGSLVLRDNVPRADAVVVERLRRAGAVVVGKGNCAEFGFGIDSSNRVGGRVLHPWSTEISPGGSSGGDAVAVATGMVDFAIGADYGGSVRWPAQSVGILGLRTGVGQVSRTGEIPGCGGEIGTRRHIIRNPWSLSGALETVGIFARSTRYLKEVFRKIRGADGFDWLSGFGGVNPPRQMLPRGGSGMWRIAVVDVRGIAPAAPAVEAAIARARAAARSAGCTVVDVGSLFDGAFETYTELRALTDHHVDVRTVCADQESLLCEETQRILDCAARVQPVGQAVSRAWGRRELVAARVAAIFDHVDVLVLPVAPTGPIPFGGTTVLNGRSLDANALMSYCRAVSLTGLPALSVPFDDAPPGTGVSIQIVGPHGSEERCCEVAEHLGLVAGLPWAKGSGRNHLESTSG